MQNDIRTNKSLSYCLHNLDLGLAFCIFVAVLTMAVFIVFFLVNVLVSLFFLCGCSKCLEGCLINRICRSYSNL